MPSGYNKILGLDIGTRSIKLAYAEKRIHSLNIILDEVSFTRDKKELIHQDLSSLIRNLVKKNKIHPYVPVVLSIGGTSAFIRTVKLPPVSPEKIDKIIQFEAGQEIPIPLKDLFWDYAIEKIEDGRLFSLIVASKKSLVDELLHVAENARLSPLMVGCDIVSLFNIVHQTEGEIPFLIADIGACHTNLIFYNKKRLYAHGLPLGGDNLTVRISQSLKISLEEAEDIKLNCPEEKKEDINILTQQFLQEIILDIHNAIDFYKSQIEGLNVEKIILTGAGSVLPGIQEEIENKLKVKADFYKLPAELSQNIKSARDPQKFLVAVANALSVFKKDYLKINLIKGKLVQETLRKKEKIYLSFSALGLALIFIIGFAFLKIEYKLKTVYLTSLHKQIAVLEKYQPEIEKLKKENSLLTEKTDIEEAVFFLRKTWVLILAELANLPADEEVWFTNFEGEIRDLTKKEAFLKLAGRTYTYRSLSNFIAELKKRDIFSNISTQFTTVVKSETSDSGSEFVEFELTMEVTPDKGL